MGRKPNPKPDDPEQARRFIEMARKVEADESEEGAEQALKKVIKPTRSR